MKSLHLFLDCSLTSAIWMGLDLTLKNSDIKAMTDSKGVHLNCEPDPSIRSDPTPMTVSGGSLLPETNFNWSVG